MKLLIQLIAAALIGAILMFVIYTPDCEQSGPSQQDYDAIKTVYESVVNENLGLIQTADSAQARAGFYDSLSQVYRKQIAGYKTMIQDSATKIKKLANQVLALTAGPDKDSICDELAAQVIGLINSYNEVSERYEYMVKYIDSASVFNEVVTKQLKQANEKLLSEYSKLYAAYNRLLSDTQGLQKSLRRQKLKTKIAAVLGIIGTGAALLR